MKISSVKIKRENVPVTSLAFTIEAILLIISIIWIIIRRIPVFRDIKITWEAFVMGVFAGILILAGGIIFYALDKGFFGGMVRKTMETRIYPLFGSISPEGIVLVAFMSGVCEEIFFRGVLLTEFGIIVSSVIFGLLHTPGKKVWLLGAWTALIGMVMALLYKATGNLFVPIVAHTVNNLVAISYVRYLSQELKKQKMKISFEKNPEAMEKSEKNQEGEYNEDSEETDFKAASADRLKKDASEVIRFRINEEVSKAKKGLREIADNVADIAKEFENEFIPHRRKPPRKADSPVQLLNSSEADEDNSKENN
jgi:uncharacterized protein